MLNGPFSPWPSITPEEADGVSRVLLSNMVNYWTGQEGREFEPGFADRLESEERAMLTIRPGITGPVTLKYRDEEEMLASVDDPEAYNRELIWPDKVQVNLDYIRHWSLWGDLRYILDTVLG